VKVVTDHSKQPGKLRLNRETVRELTADELVAAQGAGAGPMTLQCTWSGTITICRCNIKTSDIIC
jgi:hypothetical protein